MRRVSIPFFALGLALITGCAAPSIQPIEVVDPQPDVQSTKHLLSTLQGPCLHLNMRTRSKGPAEDALVKASSKEAQGHGFFIDPRHALVAFDKTPSTSTLTLHTKRQKNSTAEIIQWNLERKAALVATKAPVHPSSSFLTLQKNTPRPSDAVTALTPSDTTENAGIVSKIEKSDLTENKKFIQADLMSQVRSIGVPLLDSQGRVVGVSLDNPPYGAQSGDILSWFADLSSLLTDFQICSKK